MRIALISDIHGHVTGLKAVLARLKWLGGADLLCCLGDIIGGGPGLDDVVELLLEHDALMVRGNWDDVFRGIDAHLAQLPLDAHENVLTTYGWMSSRLSKSYQTLIGELPLNRTVEIGPEQRLFLCHAAPEDNRARVCEAAIPPELLRQTFGAIDAQIVAYGHYHDHHVLQLDDKLLVNVACVGLGWRGYSTLTILEHVQGRTSIQQTQVPYDVSEHELLIKERQMPHNRAIYYWDEMMERKR